MVLLLETSSMLSQLSLGLRGRRFSALKDGEHPAITQHMWNVSLCKDTSMLCSVIIDVTRVLFSYESFPEALHFYDARLLDLAQDSCGRICYLGVVDNCFARAQVGDTMIPHLVTSPWVFGEGVHIPS